MDRKIHPLYQGSGTPLTLDSRFRLLSFPGTTVSTPNEPEMEHALQREARDDHDWLKETGRRLLKQTEAQAVLLTRGSKGMVLFERGRPPAEIPAYGTDEVADVTGAGDTVIAVFTLALIAGATVEDAARISNYAAGIVVTKSGTATVTRTELIRAIREDLAG